MNTVLVVVGAVVLFSLVLLFYRPRDAFAAKRAILQQIAAERNGCVEGKYGQPPRLTLPFPRGNLNVFDLEGENLHGTSLACSFDRRTDFEMVIHWDKSFGLLGKTGWYRMIKVANKEFDKNFTVISNSDPRINDFLDPELQEKLLRIKDDRPILELKGETFRLDICKELADKQEYDAFIDLGLEIMGRMLRLNL